MRKKWELRVYVLAWSFHWRINERVEVYFDAYQPFEASRHQNFIVMDERLNFFGSIE